MNYEKNAFTLVELLVVIVILGIVTGLSIPLIRNIRSAQEKKQYETYRTSLSYASKVYADSFSEDLFGHDEIACANVSYNQLKAKNLIKDIPIDGVSCASNDTYVRIVKFEGQYLYLPKITCGKPQSGGAISKDVEIPEGDINSSLCGLNVPTKIDIKFSPESSHTPNVRRKNITVEFKSPTGIHSDPIIYWAFSDKADFSSIIGEWKQLDIDVPSKKKQKALILQGNTISLTKEFITPKNYSGKLYLVLKIDRLEDLGGKNWTTTDTEIVSGGYYAVDNEPPKLNDSKIEYSKPVHRKVIPTLDFEATDNLTSEGNLRMCISEDTSTDNCSKNINDIKKKQNGWVTYKKNKKLPVMNNASNGENHNIFISIGDQAGNYVSQQYVYYQSPVDYSITYSLDGGTHGTSHPSRVDFDEEFTVSHPTKKIKTTFVNHVSGCSVNYSSSTVSESGKSVNYTFNGWNITGMDNTTHTFGSRTSTNIKEDNVKETKFKGLRHTSNGVVFSATWIPPTITLPKATKTGYTCVWKSDGIEDKASGGKYKPAVVGGATERTFTTSCSANVYTISLDMQGGRNGTSKIYEKYNTGWYLDSGAEKLISTIKIPERVGYSFVGYYTNKYGEGTKVVDSNGKILAKNTTFLSNGTLYAEWKANIYKVTLNKQGGKNGTSIIYEKYTINWYLDAQAKDLIASIDIPEKIGYTFEGYFTAINGGGIQVIDENGKILSNKTTTFSSNGSLYAKWKANIYKVTLDMQGGNYGTSIIYEKYNTGWYLDNQANNLISSIDIPEKIGYNFGGYYTETNGEGTKVIDANGKILSNKTTTFLSDGSLYAKWTAKIFNVTLNKQGGEKGTSTIYEKYHTGWYSDNKANNSISTINEPIKTGYSFAGYYVEMNGGGIQVINNNGQILDNRTTLFTSNGILYAKWNARIFAITLDKQGGKNGTSKIYEKYHTGWYSDNKANTPIFSINNPDRIGYSFAGYYEEKNGNGTQIINASGNILDNLTTKFTSSESVYARWNANTFKVEYDANGGTGTTTSHNCTYDDDCSLKTSSFSKSGYKFIGWKKNNAGNTLKPKTSIKNAATSGTVTYYAQWGKLPTCSISVTSPSSPVFNGWYKTDVSLRLDVNDATSYGIGEIPGLTNNKTTFVAKKEGALDYYGYVENQYGSYNCRRTIKIDKTPPSIVQVSRCYNGNCAKDTHPNSSAGENSFYDAYWFVWRDRLSGSPSGGVSDLEGAWFKVKTSFPNGTENKFYSGLFHLTSVNEPWPYSGRGFTGTLQDVFTIYADDKKDKPQKISIYYHLCDAVSNCGSGTYTYTVGN